MVCGAGAIVWVSWVTIFPESVFAHAEPGFIIADFGLRGGAPVLVLRMVEAGHPEPVFEFERSLAEG